MQDVLSQQLHQGVGRQMGRAYESKRVIWQPHQALPASIELPTVEPQDVLNQMPMHELREITRTTLQTKTHLLSYMANIPSNKQSCLDWGQSSHS